jgi:hypothetical protein
LTSIGTVAGRKRLQRRRDALALLVQRATDRGDRPNVPRPEVVDDIIFGVIWYRLLATRRPFDNALIDDLVGTLT